MYCLNHHCRFSNNYHTGSCIVETSKNESTTKTNINNTYHVTNDVKTYVMNYVTVNNFYGDSKPQQNDNKLITNPFDVFSQLTDKK